MIKFIRNIPWKEVGIIILLAALALGAIVGIGSALTTKTKTISPLIFAKGTYNNQGIFEESDRSITNKDFLECQGLKIEPDFDATGTYQIFYYGPDKQLLGATDKLKASETLVYEKGDSFELAKYCRIVITPDAPKDENGFVVEDYKIKFYEIAGIANKYTITVEKNQKSGLKNLFVNDTAMCGKYYSLSYSNPQTAVQYNASKVISLDPSHENVFVTISNFSGDKGIPTLVFADDSGAFVETISLDDNVATASFAKTYVFKVSIPDGATSFALNYISDSSPCIYVK